MGALIAILSSLAPRPIPTIGPFDLLDGYALADDGWRTYVEATFHSNPLQYNLVKIPESRQIMRFAFVSIVNAMNRKGIVTYAVLLRDLSKMPRFSSPQGLAQRIAAWTDAWDGWAATRGAIPIDLRCFPDVDDVANYLGDQLHPNVAGTRLLAKHVAFGIAHRGVTCPQRLTS